MKKIVKENVKRIVALCILFLASVQTPILANEVQEKQISMTKTEADRKLKEAFPELKNYIDNANETVRENSVQMLANEEVEVIYRDTKETEEETIGIALMSDGTYAAYSLAGSCKWNGGNYSSGTGYTSRTNATVTVWRTGCLYTMTIYPVSYTLVQGGYDSFNATGIASTPANPYVSASAVKMKEDASGAAFLDYQIPNVSSVNQNVYVPVHIRITVGGNDVKVSADGYQL